MKIFKSIKKVGSPEAKVSGGNFTPITSLNPILVTVRKDSQLLITLTVPDTWSNEAGGGAWFAILAGPKNANKNIVARGLYTCGIGGQRVPIVLQALVDIASDQEVEVVAQWHCIGNSPCYIGSASETVLTVLVNDEHSQDEMLKSQMEKMLSLKLANTPDFPSFK